MTFQALIRSIQLYVHLENPEITHLIKDWINESILEFCRINEWEKLKVSDKITLDGTGEYSLDNTLLSSVFAGEIALLNSAGEKLTKFNYDTYLATPSKAGIWAVFGNKLYVEGEGDYYFFYISPGPFGVYPLTDDNAEPPVLLYYWDIIKQMTIVRVFEYIGDDEALQKETQRLQFKILSLKAQENRIRKQGKFKMVYRG